jgi:hypothetical protein
MFCSSNSNRGHELGIKLSPRVHALSNIYIPHAKLLEHFDFEIPDSLNLASKLLQYVVLVFAK